VLDIRGHGGSGHRCDIDYIGQIDDDLADFVTNLGSAKRAIPHGDIPGFAPPLVVSEAEIDEIVELAYQATRQVMDERSPRRPPKFLCRSCRFPSIGERTELPPLLADKGGW
jgi:hypothetical protein